MNWWEQFILSAVVGILKQYVKSPAALKSVVNVLQAVYNDLGEILPQIGGTA